MTDSSTMAYINMYGILGSLENLCDIDMQAKEIIEGHEISVGFEVKNGPCASLWFSGGRCTLKDGTKGCNIILPFSSPEKFNRLIDGTGSALPRKGITKAGFLLKTFTRLTDRLGMILKPDTGTQTSIDLKHLNTVMTFYVVAGAISQVGNHDKTGRYSASCIADGVSEISIHNGPVAYIVSENHVLRTVKNGKLKPRARMEFMTEETAAGLFSGSLNAMTCIAEGTIKMQGMISMIDSINRILDRVSIYLQ